MFRDGTGILLLCFGLVAILTFVAGFAYAEIMPECLGAICTWLIIRAIGLHHGNQRRAAPEEPRSPMPNYARIASIVFYVMTALVIGRLVIRAIPHQAPSTVHLDARIGEFCTVGSGDSEFTGVYMLQGDAIVCTDPD